MNVEFLTLAIANADIDEERRIVRGVFISEEPNNLDQIFDYNSSKPYISKWSRGFASATNGKSKGNVRLMHGLTKKGVELVGTVVELDFNDKAKTISGAVHVSDDETWRKVQEGILTGFSFGGDSKGAPWKDKIASAKYGRPMVRYTFVPRELTLCDRGRIPGTEFTSIENADLAPENQENPKMDPNKTDSPASTADALPANPAPEVVPPAEVPEQGSQPVENGVGLANQFGSVAEAFAFLIKCAESEETAEGDSQEIPAELREGLRSMIEPIKKYQARQLDELIPEESMDSTDFDIEDADNFVDLADLPEDDGSEVMENGDYPGHPFHGNQHVGASGGRSNAGKAHSASGKASSTAHRASVAAHSGGAKEHRQAASAHRAAHASAKAAGRNKVAAYHKAQVEHHRSLAKVMGGDKTGFQNADTKVENADTKAEFSRLEKLIEEQGKRIAALTASKIENADTAKLREVPHMAGTVVVTRDPIENANVEVEAEVKRLSELPPAELTHHLIRNSLRNSARFEL